MSNLNFYALYPVLYKEYIIFSTNNSILKFNRKLKTTELILNNDKPIKHIKINNDKIIFLTEYNNSTNIYMINLNTNEMEQITFTGNQNTIPINFENNEIIYITTEFSPIEEHETFKYNILKKTTEKLVYKNIKAIIKDQEDIYIQKDEYGYLNWKNYKGGRKGTIVKNNKNLLNLENQCINPILYKDKIYFIYDAPSGNNIYSCSKNGENLKQNTFHTKFKILSMHLQNNEIIYSIMGDLYILNLETEQINIVEILYKINKPTQTQKISEEFLTSIDMNKNNAIFCIKGNVFEKNIYSGGFMQISNSLRFTHCGYLKDDYFAFKDGKITQLFIFEDKNNPKIFDLDPQKIINIKSNSKDSIAYSNHKNELKIINKEGKEILIDKSQYNIKYFDWSSDGEWLTYSTNNETSSNIYIYSIKTNEKLKITNDIYYNYNPKFDPENKFIMFLSNRNSKIKLDNLKYDYYSKITNNIFFIPLIENYDMTHPCYSENSTDEQNSKINYTYKDWNLLNIQDKIINFPVKSNFIDIFPIENKILLLKIKKNKNVLYSFNLNDFSEEILFENFEKIEISQDKKNFAFFTTEGIRISKVGEKPDEKNLKQKNILIENINTITTKSEELSNIFEELTWLIEEFFWNESTKIEHQKILQLYSDHLKKINTEEELYHMLSQIQGEMKTSHAYIFPESKESTQGKLGCDFTYDEKNDKFYISNIFKQDGTILHPFFVHNTNIEEGSYIKKINNQKINKDYPIEKALANQAKKNITIEIEKNKKEKTFEIQTITKEEENQLRYKDLVQKRRSFVQSHNKNIGYIHIKDMTQLGFKSFFEQYNAQYDKKCLIIDVRNNHGGNISSLLIEQLTKKKLGLDLSRHNKVTSFPVSASEGNFVLLTNSHTASDGEIFSKHFKLLNLGKSIGERTWGGVIGILPRFSLIDNTITSQPEFGIKFFNSTEQLENVGFIPDIQIEDNWKTNKIEEDTILNEAIKYSENTFLKEEEKTY